MRVLLSFDKFKDSLTAPEACGLASAALRDRQPNWTLDLCPLTDGGEGFCEILTRAAGGTLEKISVTGPRGEPVEASVGFVSVAHIPPAARALLLLSDPQLSTLNSQPMIAIVEMAAASGLALLPESLRDPWQTSSVGTGELIRFAAGRGVAAILVGIGGSATHDLGLGALSALGVKCLSADGAAIRPPVPARWREVTQLAGRVAQDFPPIRIACDVANPLLGPRGAATVYGPQKGLRPESLAHLEQATDGLARLLIAHCGKNHSLLEMPGTGAAGGIAVGLMAAARAEIVTGFALVSAWLDLDARLAAADLVITGEGRFDASSLDGKGPGAVAARAAALGKPVHVFAGAITVPAPPPGLTLHAITAPGTPLAAALLAAPANLAAAVRAAF